MRSYLGFSLAIFSALTSAIVSILIKKLTNIKAHFSVLIIYAGYVGLPTSLIITLVLYLVGAQKHKLNLIDKHELMWQIFFSITSAVSGLIGQILLTTSFKHEDATKISVLRYN